MELKPNGEVRELSRTQTRRLEDVGRDRLESCKECAKEGESETPGGEVIVAECSI